MEIGQKVVCIDASKQPHTVEELSKDCPNWVTEGKTYTVRGFQDADFVVGVLLEEIVNPIRYFSLIGKARESAFATWRFRPLQENEAIVEINEESLVH